MMHLLLAASEKSGFKCFLGALHPGIVHFPIALLTAAAFLEILQILRKKKEQAPATVSLTWLAAAAAIPASFFGFMLADSEGAEGRLIDLHQWLGVASTVVALAAAACAIKSKTSPGALTGLRVALLVGTGLVLGTGYVGGELVFGENHIFKCFKGEKPEAPKSGGTLPEKLVPVSGGANTVDFAKEIAPIMKDMCFKCHGGEKVKGKFKMNTKASAMEGGESGKEILPHKPALSKFYTSLTLEKDNDDLMPPIKEKARPTKEQIERVRKWIEEGADWPDGYEITK
ncbi:MAG TPA: c-type cytochrome domain-containing protein [Planctomycetota bacterium]|nr:c-type cytochrome domain-containing protein [Planctomycetota bacterium]